jgi:hypothetical protein
MEHGIATYQATPEAHGRGTYFFTDCGHKMYSVKNDYNAYHECLCPGCFWEGKETVLYIRGSKEANEYLGIKLSMR